MEIDTETHPSATQTQHTANHQEAQRIDPVHDMVYTLKSQIDQNGKYKYRLNDMAVGYAAGSGKNRFEAKAEIQDKFEQVVGQSPHDYLQQHYSQMRGVSQTRQNGYGQHM